MRLPQGWEIVSFSEITPPTAPIIYGILQPGPDRTDGIPYVRPTEIVDEAIDLALIRRTSPEIARRYARSSLKHDDTILTIVGTIGKVAAVPQELEGGNITQSSCRIRTDRKVIEPALFRHFLRSPSARLQYDQKRLGTAVPRLNIADIRSFQLPVPPTAEQHRILAKLNSLTTRLVRARAELDRVPALAERHRQAVLATEFSQEAGPVVELGTLTLPSAPVRYGVLQPGDEKGVGVQMIRVCDLRNMSVAWSELRRIAPEIDRQFANARVQNGDVLLSVVGTIGRVAVVAGMAEPTNIARAVARLRPDPAKVLPMWLAFRLASPDCQAIFAGDAREVARKTLNVSLIKAVPIAVPSLSAQAETVRKVEAAFARADRLEAEAARAGTLLYRLEAAILAKAFRGELVPQDPADEPASVLLECIRAERAAAPEAKRGPRASAQSMAADA